MLFEPTSDCPCSLKWDGGLWGNINTSNGKFDVDWQPKKGFNIAGLYEGPGMSITGTASNDGYQVGARLQLPIMSIAGIANNDGFQVGASLEFPIISIIGNTGNNGSNLGVVLPILDGGALGGIYKDGQLGIQGIVPIKLPDGQIIKIDGYYIDKSTWEIKCIPFEFKF